MRDSRLWSRSPIKSQYKIFYYSYSYKSYSHLTVTLCLRIKPLTNDNKNIKCNSLPRWISCHYFHYLHHPSHGSQASLRGTGWHSGSCQEGNTAFIKGTVAGQHPFAGWGGHRKAVMSEEGKHVASLLYFLSLHTPKIISSSEKLSKKQKNPPFVTCSPAIHIPLKEMKSTIILMGITYVNSCLAIWGSTQQLSR